VYISNVGLWCSYRQRREGALRGKVGTLDNPPIKAWGRHSRLYSGCELRAQGTPANPRWQGQLQSQYPKSGPDLGVFWRTVAHISGPHSHTFFQDTGKRYR